MSHHGAGRFAVFRGLFDAELWPSSLAAVVLHVAPDGNDAWSGACPRKPGAFGRTVGYACRCESPATAKIA